MKKEIPEDQSSRISKALMKIISKDISHKANYQYIEDIIYLLVDELSKGNLYINLDEKNQSVLPKAIGWPSTHLKALVESGLLESESEPIIMTANKLSWRRWNYEMNDVIQKLIAKDQLHKKNFGELKPCATELPIKNQLNSQQFLATQAILKTGVVLLSGGPGTGKTSTVIQMLIKVLSLTPNLKIGLAAPTGKATRRLQDAIQATIQSSNIQDKGILSNIPCQTLHTWLQARPNGFGKNKNSPLNLDLLVIDEMSMVDLVLMQAILEALPKKSKLILVGDPNQLPPIGSGAVWQELHEQENHKNFREGTIHLSKIYRSRGDIAKLSKTLKENDAKTFWKEITSAENSSNVQLYFSSLNTIPFPVLTKLKVHQKKLEKLAREFKSQLGQSVRISSAKIIKETKITNDLFECLESLMVLSPRRSGRWGINHLHQTLLDERFHEGIMYWPEGTPIICAENQPELGLSNGDVGLLIGKSSQRRLLFKLLSKDHQFAHYLIHPSRVKSIEPAFALTIHKSQGSESKKVMVLWPNSLENSINQLSPDPMEELFDERLLYTAITRAKENLEIFINKDFSLKKKN